MVADSATYAKRAKSFSHVERVDLCRAIGRTLFDGGRKFGIIRTTQPKGKVSDEDYICFADRRKS